MKKKALSECLCSRKEGLRVGVQRRNNRRSLQLRVFFIGVRGPRVCVWEEKKGAARRGK